MDEYKLTPDMYSPKTMGKHPVQVCALCGFPFPTNKMRKYKGKWYCRPNTCADDIPSMKEGRRK